MRHAALLNAKCLPADSTPGSTPLVFAHGYGCDQGMWRDVSALLPQHERWLFDWPGAGQSLPEAYDPVRHATLDGYADDLLELVRAIDRPGVTVVAHSVAASIAMLAALREPESIGRLILVTPSPCFLRDPPDYDGGFDRSALEGLLEKLAEGLESWSAAMAPVLMGTPDRPDLDGRLASSLCRQDPSIALRWARATFLSDLRPVVSRLTLPVHVLQAREDALVPASVGPWMREQLPRGRLWALQAVGHCPHVSAPGEVAAIIRRCLSNDE